MHAVLLSQNAARPNRGRHRIVQHADQFAAKVGRLSQGTVVLHMERCVAERAIGKNGNGVEPIGAAVLRHDIVGQGKFADFIGLVPQHGREDVIGGARDVTQIYVFASTS